MTTLTADQEAALKELYCRPDRCNLTINGRDMSQEMTELGAYRQPTGAGMHPITDYGRRLVKELIEAGKW